MINFQSYNKIFIFSLFFLHSHVCYSFSGHLDPKNEWLNDECPKQSSYTRLLGSFHLVISAFSVVHMILVFLCISGEKGGIWRLCGDVKKEIGEPSLNVMTFSRRDVKVV